MINKTLVTLILSTFFVSCIPNNKQDTEFSAQFIINKYYESVGGYEQLKKVETLSKYGHYIEPAYNIVVDATVQKRRPNYRIIGDLDVVGFEEGFNGQAWEYHRGKGLILSEGEAKEVILVSSEFDYPFIDAKEKGHEVKYNGLITLEGIPVHDIQVVMQVMNTQYVTNFYFDTNSYLLVGQRKVMPIHAVGEDVEIIVKYSDYRIVDGLLYPFAHIERNRKTGTFLNSTIWNKIEPNTHIPLSVFDPPSEGAIEKSDE